jgi:pantothenate synthetase
VLLQNCLTIAPTIKEMIPPGFETSLTAVYRHILNRDSEPNNFDGIVTGNESWFRFLSPSFSIFAPSRTDVIPRKRPEIRTSQTMMKRCNL